MSDDEMPELEDLSNDLEIMRHVKGMNNQVLSEKETEIKVNVIESKDDNNSNQTNNNTNQAQSQSQTTSNTKTKFQPKPNQSNNEDNFGKGFGKGFFKKKEASNQSQQAQSQPQIEDLTHIKSNPGSTNKTSTVETFNKDLKESLPNNNLSSLSNNMIDKKDDWLNQDLLMKIAKNPNLMKYFMDPRFTSIIQEMQKNPKECMEKYGSNPEFSTFIREFSQIMGIHFNNLAGKAGNYSNMNDPEVQKVLNDPKVIPFLTKLRTEGKMDIEELNKDPYLKGKVDYLIEKKILNIQKMN